MTPSKKTENLLPFTIPARWRIILDDFFFKSALVFALGGIISIISLYFIPSDEDNILLLGLSRNRLVMAGTFFAVNSLILLAAVKWRGFEKRIYEVCFSRKKGFALIITGLSIVFIVGLMLLLSPDYRFWQFYYFTALIPFIAWVTLGLFLCLLPIAINKGINTAINQKALRGNHIDIKKPLKISVSLLFVLIFMMLLFRLGFKPDINYWNENGIPLLLTQILLSLLISQLVLAGISKIKDITIGRFKTEHILDAFIFVAIWIAAAVILNATPAVRTHFSPGPYPPNYVLYPISDAMIYDQYAQQALLGEGFAWGGHIGKPLLAAMLVLFHTLARGDYSCFFMVQAAFLAVIPAFLYLIGKRLHGYAAGILAALFVLFLERNTYQAILYLSSSHSKLIMSEVPAVLYMVIGTYFLITGLNNQNKYNLAALGVSAGVMGLSTMVRENTLILVPLPFLFLFIQKGLHWRKKIMAALVMTLFLFSAVTPWAIRTKNAIGTPFYFAPKIQTVILNRRLSSFLDREETRREIRLAAHTVGQEGPLAPIFMNNQGMVGAGFSVHKFNPTAFFQPAEPERLAPGEAIKQHFFHNLITSFAILPVSLSLEDLTHSAQDNLNTFPGMNEELRLKPLTIAAIGFNLFILAIGISFAWKKKGSTGMVPLAVFLVYCLALALARSSGGRYIVGMNWALLLYYAIGVGYGILWLASRLGFGYATGELLPNDSSNDFKSVRAGRRPAIHVISGFLVIAAIGLLVPFSETAFPERYTDEPGPQAIGQLFKDNLISAETYEAYSQMSAEEELSILHGKLLYPRFYLAGEEINHKARGGFVAMDFPRLHIFLMGEGLDQVILPLGEPPGPIPDSADTYVVGCKDGIFYARLMLVHNQQTGQYDALWRDKTQPDPCLELP